MTREIAVASLLVPYLQNEIDKRGWSQTDLGIKCGISKSNISKLFKNPQRIPQTVTLLKLARGLDVPPVRLIKLCGFDVGEEDDPVDTEQVAILFETMPELRGVVRSWSQLTLEYRRALLSYADGLRRQQQSQA